VGRREAVSRYEDIYLEEVSAGERLVCSWPFRLLLVGIALYVIYVGMRAMNTSISIGADEAEAVIATMIDAWGAGWAALGTRVSDYLGVESALWRRLIPLIMKGAWTVLASYSFVRPLFAYEYLEDLLNYVVIALALVGVAFIIMYSMGYAMVRW